MILGNLYTHRYQRWARELEDPRISHVIFQHLRKKKGIDVSNWLFTCKKNSKGINLLKFLVFNKK